MTENQNTMKQYYLNLNSLSNGEREVHKDGCIYLHEIKNMFHLGLFSSCHEALSEAQKNYAEVNGCHYCCSACKTN